nr:tetraspanin-6-like [Parasteatoda tepidariorum]
MRYSKRVIRYILFIFNFLFVICGLALIAVGAVGTTKDMTHFLNNKYISVPYIIIAVGCVIFVVAFFGCCGALKYSHFMISIYGLLIVAIVVIEVAGGITAYLHKGEVEDFVKQSMNESLAQQRKDSIKIWHFVQSNLLCCGIDGAKDYAALNIKIPRSCCKFTEEGCIRIEMCPDEDCPETDAWKQGCYPRMIYKIKESIEIVGGVAIGIAVVELVGCMFAWCLAHAIKKDDERR